MDGTSTTEHPPRCSVVVVGAPCSGKTTLIAAMAALAALPGAPEPHTGPTTGITLTRLSWRAVGLDVIDTPGHPELAGGVRAGLRAADSVLFVVSAVDGLDAATAMLWRECAAEGRVRVLAVTDIDDERADVDETLSVCQRVLGEAAAESHDAPILPALVPLAGDDDEVAGLLDIVTLRVLDLTGGASVARAADPEHVAAVQTVREDLVHAALSVSEDEVLLAQVLADEAPDPHRLATAVWEAVALDALSLAFPVASPAAIGVPQLLDALVATLPLASAREAPAAVTLDGDPRGPWHGSVGDPFVAEVVAVDSAGQLLRVWAGSVREGEAVNVTPADGLAFGAVLTMAGQPDGGSLMRVRLSPAAPVGATVSADELALRLSAWGLPEPAFEVLLTAGARDVLPVLRELVAADPVAVLDAATTEPTLRTAGPAHADAVVAALAARGIDATWHAAPTSLRSTVRQAATAADDDGTSLAVTPLALGAGLECDDAELAVAAAARPFPLTDVRLEPHPTGRSGTAHLLERAVESAGQVLLEPVDEVTVEVSDEYAADVTDDLRRRRGRVSASDAAGGGRTRVSAVVPRASLASYDVELRAVSHATAVWSREPAGYHAMPSYLAARLIAPGAPSARTTLPLA